MSFGFGHRLPAPQRLASGGGGGSWTPASVTGIVDYWTWADSSRVWQDAGVTPAGNGDLVGRYRGQLGVLNAEATDDYRPYYDTTIGAIKIPSGQFRLLDAYGVGLPDNQEYTLFFNTSNASHRYCASLALYNAALNNLNGLSRNADGDARIDYGSVGQPNGSVACAALAGYGRSTAIVTVRNTSDVSEGYMQVYVNGANGQASYASAYGDRMAHDAWNMLRVYAFNPTGDAYIHAHGIIAGGVTAEDCANIHTWCMAQVP